MKHLVLIDGHHLMYRAFYAIPPGMMTKSGEMTNAVFGVASMILSILKAEEPDSLLFCFDAGEETFRHKENATYKDGRAETPDTFILQIPRIMELVSAFGFKSVSDKEYEADDYLGVYACAAEKAGMRVTIVTGDRDAFQLATPHVRIAIPHKAYQAAEYLGPEEIVAKYGIRPDQVPDYKGLVGDASDNLPGVKGIGPKIAAGLLQQFGTLRGIYDHLESIKSASVREKLAADREQAFQCARLATLQCDLPLPVSLEDVQLQELPIDPVRSLFRQLEFTLLSRRLESLISSPYGKAHFWSVTDVMAEPEEEEKQMTLF